MAQVDASLANLAHCDAIAKEHRPIACAPSGDFRRCFQCSGLQTRWAHRLQIYVPELRLRGAGLRSFVLKNNWRFKFGEARQRFRLTPTEKRVAVFVLAAVVLGLATKCYRDTHFSPTPATWKIEQGRSVRTTKAKRVSPEPTRDVSDR